MDSTATLKDAEEKLKALNLAAIVMKTAETKNLNFAKLSKLMHKSDSFVSARLGRKKLSMPILFALSQHLQTNLFEPYTTPNKHSKPSTHSNATSANSSNNTSNNDEQGNKTS